MTRSTDDLPPALESLWRMMKLAYRVEPRLLSLSLAMTLFTALPQALIGLWLAILVDGVRTTTAGRCSSPRSVSPYRPPCSGISRSSSTACNAGSATA